MFKPLDPLLTNELRLAIMSILLALEEAEFNFIKAKTKATSGNLSIQLKKLKEVEYIDIKKTFKDNYPLTTCVITNKGIKAFEQHVDALKSYITIKQ